MNKVISVVELSISSFTRNKARTALAVLGVTIGIASIIIVFAAGEGIKGILAVQAESFGTHTVQAEIKVPSSKPGVAGERQSATNLLRGAQITTMNEDDLKDILDLPNIVNGYGLYFTKERVSYRNEIASVSIWASGAAFIDIDQAEVQAGRFFTDSEDKSLAKVAVLGVDTKKKLFGDSDPIGRTIKIRDIRFEVIGVMEERGGMVGFNFDEMVYVPVKTVQKRILGIDHYINILAEVDDMDLVNETMEEMRMIMRENHNIDAPEEVRESIWDTGKDDFRIVSMVEAVEVFDDMYFTVTLMLLAIVAISSIVGGIGVMNVMYVIVNERTPEIGLRKAVGAKRKDILNQFLIESILITGMGGIAGTIIGVLTAFAISHGAEQAGFSWPFAIPLIAFVVAFAFSVIFGIIFGIFPARKAAKLDPIEALQHNK
jgi:putative ABC transport system permease protein